MAAMERPRSEPEPRSDWWTVPNLLSFGRLAATPILVWLIIADEHLVGVVLLGVMGVTDYLDGYIARRTDQVSELGILLDPVSDRVLIMAAIVALMVSGDLPLWLGIPVLARDAALSAVFLFLSRRGFGRPKVRKVGKSATFGLLFGLPAIMIPVLRPLGLVAFGIGGVLYYVAAFRYTQDARAFLAEHRAPFA